MRSRDLTPPAQLRLARTSSALTILGLTTILQAGLVPAALAQSCNGQPNPAPVSSGVKDVITGGSFSGSNPGTPSMRFLREGAAGCNGAASGGSEKGATGVVGQQGAVNAAISASGFTVTGSYADPAFRGRTASVVVLGSGGAGGAGGRGGSALSSASSGGIGAVGGTGGQLDLTLGAHRLEPATPGANLGRALYVEADGGAGGAGGASSGYGRTQIGGLGGLGGAGGRTNVVMTSPSLTANLGRLAAVSANGGNGGDGGGAPTWNHLMDTYGGYGGQGGTGGTARFQLRDGSVRLAFSGAVVDADGGAGGAGGGGEAAASAHGGNGGTGGQGGLAYGEIASAATMTVTGSDGLGSEPVTGLFVRANGGIGGRGGDSGPAINAGGGHGGDGGAGGTAQGLVNGAIILSTSSAPAGSAALRVEANGGRGGEGMNINSLEGRAQSGGKAGNGGTAYGYLGGSDKALLKTTSEDTHGALIQSIGGGGGDGGAAQLTGFAGDGANGGNGGDVTFEMDNGKIEVTGAGARGIVAQSIGGGGGSGGDKTTVALGVGVAIGGNGGQGGNGGAVGVTLSGGTVASTGTTGHEGVLAQSIGGAGGAGGSAVSTGVGLFALTIGGDAKGGGSGGTARVENKAATIGTYGSSAAAMLVQSVGGGGGKGGMAATLNAGVAASLGVAVGGRGGSGGAAGAATGINGTNGQLETFGADAAGMLVQSIGGGGGEGGAAMARVLAISPKANLPQISASFAVGGAGGAGNTGGTASGSNAGMITTAGDKAVGMMVQSVGGGGGKGGDATASSYSGSAAELERFEEGKFANPSSANIEIALSVALGGKGGTGALGGTATAVNAATGLIGTFGQDAYGMQVQSIGGGGGSGGAGDASARTSAAKTSYAMAMGVGGTGGTGGHGGAVTASNLGSIATSGDGAAAAMIQSVGGGGGAAGGGVANAGGGTIAVSLAVGGDGGAGGNGGKVDFQNGGAILTRGAAAAGILAQSVGGGGGIGGKGASTVGGSTRGVVSNSQVLFDTLAAGFGTPKNAVQTVDNIYKNYGYADKALTTVDDLKTYWKYIKDFRDKKDLPEVGAFKKITVAVGVGGKGGAAGDGGVVSVTNSRQVATEGAQSDGIRAQSVGGGGGIGGSASASAKSGNDSSDQVALSVGGKGGAAGNGNAVTVMNATGGSIVTAGASAFGINAQSVGGGGGEGSYSGSIAGSLRSLSLGIGGDQGAHGNGGTVKVQSDGSLHTSGKQAIGIFAQSIGGGGGLVRSNDIVDTFNPLDLAVNKQNRLLDVHGYQLTFGGKGAAGGSGGAVTVGSTGGTIWTEGRNAHAILAQSIGGGGGFASGGQASNFGLEVNGAAGAGGHGGAVGVNLSKATILTTGDGASGIFAQSVGGGGGLGGDITLTTVNKRGFARNQIAGATGDGGNIAVSLADASKITTTGKGAHAIMAQSVGGGGGMIAYTNNDRFPGAFISGTAGGQGRGGAIAIEIGKGSTVSASGAGSAGIYAQVAGKTDPGKISIKIEQGASVSGGLIDTAKATDADHDMAAIRLIGGAGNSVTVRGSVTALDAASGGLAIKSSEATGTTGIDNFGTITGDVDMAGITTLANRDGATLDARKIALAGGKLTNDGTLLVGGRNSIGDTSLKGDLVQTASGHLAVDLDLDKSASDHLTVSGAATLDGTVDVNALSLAKGVTHQVLTADGGLTLGSHLTAAGSYVFTHNLLTENNALSISTDADFTKARSAENSDLALHLQRVWDSGDTGFGSAFAALDSIGVGDAARYDRTLQTLDGAEVASIAAARIHAGQEFARSLYNSCPSFNDASASRQLNSCSWVRVSTLHADHDASGGVAGYNWNSDLIKIGGQYEIASDLFLGGSVAYEKSRLHSDDYLTGVKGRALMTAVALRHQVGRWTLTGAADLGWGRYDSSRHIPVANATAEATPRSFNSGLHFKAAYQMAGARFYVEPALELDAAWSRLRGYSETGAGALNLQVEDARLFTLTATPLVRVGTRFDLKPGMMLETYGEAGVSFISGGDVDSKARFAAAPDEAGGFSTRLQGDNRVLRLSTGVKLYTEKGMDIRAQYDGLFSGSTHSNSAQLRATWRF